MIKAVGYLRRSKAAEDKTISLLEQESQIRRYCLEQKWELARIIVHNGVSGAKRARWDDIYRDISLSNATVLVIYNLDRLSRDVVGLMDNLRQLAKMGVQVHEVGTGRVHIDKSASKLTVGVRGLMDEFYRDVISEKTTDALAYKKGKRMRYTRIAPLGWKFEEGRMEIDQEEQRGISIVLRAAQSGLGARKTLDLLYQENYKGRMSLRSVHRLLQKSKLQLEGQFTEIERNVYVNDK